MMNLSEVEWLEVLQTGDPAFADSPFVGVRRGRLTAGVSAGIEIVELSNGLLRVWVLPTRGMGIWRAAAGPVPVGWDSPVTLPVHPALVNLRSRNGLGWLDGFNELLCRCGLSFNGPPGTDEGQPSPLENEITLHGRIANLPAHSVSLHADEAAQLLTVRGVVEETTLFGPRLQLVSSISIPLEGNSIWVHDEVTNLGASPTELQLLYHTNVGAPFLEQGSTLTCPARKVIPRDTRAAGGVSSWSSYLGPTPGYTEEVYFFELLGDRSGQTAVLLANRARNLGFCMRFQLDQLPRFTQWKCTQPAAAGYVTGLEPGINYPNFKSFERHHGRVPQLAPGEARTFAIELEILDQGAAVQRVQQEISALQVEPTRTEPHPISPYC
jgi:hypothetical protein